MYHLKNTIHYNRITLIGSLALAFVFLIQTSGSAQTRNFYVEGEGDQMGVIHALSNGAGASGTVGLELIRGGIAGDTDWRIINDEGVLRFQSEINNFQTNGDNKFTILENGDAGIGCSNPLAKLSICSGQIAFSNALAESQADKISLDGYDFDQTDMVGLGYETTVIAGPGGTEEFSDLYFKAEGSHRWYNNENADGGTSANMVLNNDGELGVGIINPKRFLDVRNVMRVTNISDNPTIEFYDNNQLRIESKIEDFPGILSIAGLYKDIIFAASTNGSLQNRMRIKASNGFVGIATESPDTRLHVVGGSDVTLASGGYLQLGESDAPNIVIDNNEIMARDDGTSSPLFIQKDKGNVMLCGSELGQVGIGVLDPANLPDPSYLLAVDGKIVAEEVRVELSSSWPDYVFRPEYKLRSIEELDASIKRHGHLPGIPSATEIEKGGLELGDMQKRMMEKIEELSLYVIQLNGANKVLQVKIESLTELIKTKN